MSIKAGPATETQIIYAAVVGTSIPKIKHAIAVNNKANDKLLLEKEIISEVNFIPNPVIDKTPIIIEAHNIIDAIREICFPANKQVSMTLFKPK